MKLQEHNGSFMMQCFAQRCSFTVIVYDTECHDAVTIVYGRPME